MATNIGMLTGTGAFVPVYVGGVTRYDPQDQLPAPLGTSDLNERQPPTTIPGSTIGGGSMSQMGVIGGVLGATGPTTSPAGKAAIDRLQNQADREACNASGGFYTLGGACLTGKEAEEQVNKIMNNPDAPARNKQAAEAWLERNAGETEDTTETEATTTPAIDADDNFLGSVLDKMPDDLRDFIKDLGEDPAEVLKKILDGMPDIADQLKRGQVGVEVIFDDWKNSNIFGPFVIPGVPLPPGIIDVTYNDIEKAVKAVGGSINDVIDGIKEGNAEEAISKVLSDAGTWVKNTVGDVVSGVADDPFGGTLGGLGDWVTGVLGQVIGGSVLADIYDDISGLFDPDSNTLIVPGGTAKDTTTTADVITTEDVVTDTTKTERLSFDDFGYSDIVGGSFDTDDNDDIGSTRLSFDDFPYVPEPTPDPVEIGGSTDDVVIEPKPDPIVTDGVVFDPEPTPDPVVIGGFTDGVVFDPEPTPDPVEIGGPTPTPSGGGGGGGGGGAGGTADPFLRGLSYTPTVPVAIRQQAPVDFASGLMSPTTSMDAIGQLIFRNLA